jgi:hypothetical protein
MHLKARDIPSRPAVLVTALLFLLCLAPAGCENKKASSSPDLVVFATGSLFGQLHTCG